MYSANKRKVTISLLVTAGMVVAIALLLGVPRDEAVASSPGPRIDNPGAPLVDPPTPPVPIVVRPVIPPPDPPQPAARPQVDVVFVLDTTGSMGGLIAGAKRKIWSMANQIASGQPKPDIRIGLIAYRDLGDEYVTRRFALSEDMEDVYSNLSSFRADGGGDTPEHVNLALAEAIRKMQWREGQNVLRQIYLVGDAPPHDGRQGLYTADLTAEARRKGIIINAVRCGEAADTEIAWRRISTTTGGMYASIAQDGAMVAVATPHDRRLAELNARLTATLLPTGSGGAKAGAMRRASINAGMDGLAQAESATYRARSGRVDSSDLLAVMAKGKKLSDMKREELPAPVAALPAEKQAAYVAKVAKERDEVKAEINKLSRDREAYIRAKRPAKTAFDDTVGAALKVQGKRAGIAY